MKALVRRVLVGTISLGLSLPALAQSAPGMMGMMGMGGMGMGGMGPQHEHRDCSKAPNPEQCKTRQAAVEKARQSCADKQGAERRQCMEAQRPNQDCSGSPNAEQCQKRQAARKACEGKTGPEMKECLKGQMKPSKPQ